MRKIKLLKTAERVNEGAGVKLYRAFGYYDVPLFDPFLLMDDFRNDNPEDYLAGFPWHPHRGIETITYILKGTAEHGDSIGNSGVIGSGDLQWMTAGSGIIHQEMPKPDESGSMHGFQLWANLPASHKMMKPRYQDVKKHQVQEVTDDNGARVKVLSGEYMGVKGAVEDIMIEPQYWDVVIPAGKKASFPAPLGHTCFIYAYGGEAIIDGQKVVNRQVVLFEDGEGITI
ncbi:MAG: pirin family protein, partial [Candidatus Cloacimonetes bacterium]|nr:pirin family protein [Candidatus Cloacimonadota bacterium]